MTPVRIAPAAEADLADLQDYLVEQSPSAARSVLARIQRGIQRVAAHPGIGHLREDLCSEAFLFWSVPPYLIIYRRANGSIEIIRVLHGAQDVAAILEDS